MAVTSGSHPFGLWVVTVSWQGDSVYRVHFGRTGPEGAVHPRIRSYLMGQEVDPALLHAPAADGGGVTAAIYRAVRRIGYGDLATYGEIAELVGTSSRVVGQAMARNPTPLVIPCHRIVSKNGLGGFTPSVTIKRDLLAMEERISRKRRGG